MRGMRANVGAPTHTPQRETRHTPPPALKIRHARADEAGGRASAKPTLLYDPGRLSEAQIMVRNTPPKAGQAQSGSDPICRKVDSDTPKCRATWVGLTPAISADRIALRFVSGISRLFGSGRPLAGLAPLMCAWANREAA